ncbi:autotransporter outer membrane beta-barrel domain-containing protein [Erythrobacter sp.]|uniref:autotransporter outer membrane beta-barrel domain-containing protein n=1 Tax=Erythrobacter sp. TaxID=1042 RepID=UPI001B0C2A44|nr:autotransporter outer membrane beta-barrel domain-containing protein [Erythrobacter sp.]MBO6527527.1 autotransporter outer membrane beta-barrel domain-containing protein [Erythrobacter sp.]MBO6530207.1 autotransporter outer membrane beta-barrel domain-containing protein [Erythrobacter sp.]
MTIAKQSGSNSQDDRKNWRWLLAASAIAVAAVAPEAGYAQALPPECDPDVATPGDTVVCAASAPNEIDGISTNVDDLTIIVGDAATPTTVRATGFFENGVSMSGFGELTLDVSNENSRIIGSYVGVDITSFGGELVLGSEGAISGNYGGVRAVNYSRGSTAIGVSSATAELAGRGIDASGAGGIAISATGPVAGYAGVRARNSTYGAVSITVTDVEARGFTGIGIEASNSATDGVFDPETGRYETDILVSATGRVSAGGEGISTSLDGFGATIIRAGSVESRYADGISATAGSLGGPITIDAIEVSGGANGISAYNASSSVSIASSGRVAGANTGVYAYSRTDLSLSLAEVEGGTAGIDARSGTGLTIEVGGTARGGETGILARNGGYGSIEDTERVFSVNAVNAIGGTGNGIDARVVGYSGSGRSYYGVDLAIVSTGTVSGGRNGIFALNEGGERGKAGSISIEVADVTGSDGDGIYARTGETAGGLAITATGRVSGGRHAITALNSGSGALTISANETRGGDGSAIYAVGSGSASDLTIVSTGLASSAEDAILATNYGSGALSIEARDSNSENANGILGLNSSYGTDLRITSTGLAEGAASGINAQNAGSGALSIEAFDSYGYSGSGIRAVNSPNGTDLTVVSLGEANGGADGIYAANYGSGSLTITAADSFGDEDAGIAAYNSANGINLTIAASRTTEGGYTGIKAVNAGSGDLTINAGKVSGIGANDTEEVTLDTSVVDIASSVVILERSRTVTRTDGEGVGIFAINAGEDLSITATDTVESAGTGIYARNTGTGALSLDLADVSAEVFDGISAFNSGTDLTIVANGTIEGGRDGIKAVNEGEGALSITATDVIGKGFRTYELREVSRGALRYGVIYSSVSGKGISATNDGSDLLISTTGTVEGLVTGIEALQRGTGDLVINAQGPVRGTLDAGFGFGIDARHSGEGDVEIESTTIIGRLAGINVRKSQSGDVTVTSDYALGTNSSYLIGGDGISVNTSISSDGDVRITSTTLAKGSDRGDGIGVFHQGTGSVSITANDTLSSYRTSCGSCYINNAAIDVFSPSAAGDVEIVSTGLAKAENGIKVSHGGTGTVRVTASRTDGVSYSGISVINRTSDTFITSTGYSEGGANGISAVGVAGDIHISAVDTEGAFSRAGYAPRVRSGIFAKIGNDTPEATGSIFITSTGTAYGRSYGIRAELDGAGDIAITSTGTALGKVNGISAQGNGTGTITVVSHDAATLPPDIILDGKPFEYGLGFIEKSVAVLAANGYQGGDISILSTGLADGARHGIEGRQNGIGSLTIDALDTVGRDNAAIAAVSGGRDLSIVSRGTAIGGTDGIRADNFGTGELSISVLGDVTGLGGDGISAYNSANYSTSSVTIDQGAGTTTTGAVAGIYASNEGGSLTIAALGTAIGETDDGIEAVNASTATDLVITSTNAVGEQRGIYALNLGSGSLTVESQDARGNAFAGISAFGYGTDISVNSNGSATGGRVGLYSGNYGSGSLTISAVDTAGGFGGISARNYTGTSLTVVSTGTASGGVDGVPSTLTLAKLLDFENGDTLNSLRLGIGALNAGSGPLTLTSNNAFGGDLGIAVFNAGDGASITTTGISQGGFIGIGALNLQSGSLSIEAADTSGANYAGILAINQSDGDLAIASTGDANGGLLGIGAQQYGSGDVTIAASGSVVGGGYGISVNTAGTGGVSITTADVTAIAGTGILALAQGGGIAIDTTAGLVTGANFGILARDLNGGNIAISTGGVSGGASGAIAAITSTGDIVISTSGPVASPAAGQPAIFAQSAGGDIAIGATVPAPAATASIVASNAVAAKTDGEPAQGAAGSTAIADGAATGQDAGSATVQLADASPAPATVEAGQQPGSAAISRQDMIAGGINGAQAAGASLAMIPGGENAPHTTSGLDLDPEYASGPESITLPRSGSGIAVAAKPATVDAVGTAAAPTDVSSTTASAAGAAAPAIAQADAIPLASITTSADGATGIMALTQSGNVTINASSVGTYGANATGIMALSESGNVSLSSQSVAVSGTGSAAILGRSGSGDVSIVAGSALAFDMAAITAEAGGRASVTVNDFVDSAIGNAIVATAGGDVDIAIGSGGLVFGGLNGVVVETLGGTATITNSGVLSGIDHAVFVTDASGGSTILESDGIIVGSVRFGSADDSFANTGTFIASGVSDFGSGLDSFENGGLLTYFGDVTLQGLESFVNRGTIAAFTDSTDDSLTISGDWEGSGLFAIDVNFDNGGSADVLQIDGAATGSTGLVLNDLSTTPSFGVGVVVVDASAGTEATAFSVASDQVQTIGFLSYALGFDAANNNFVLSNAIGAPVFQTTKFAEGAQASWSRSADAWSRHMVALRDGETASPPLWMQFFGSTSQRDQSFDYTSAFFTQAISLDYMQDFFGWQVGLDSGSGVAGDGLLYGATAGFLSSNLAFDGTADRVGYEALNLGAYIGYRSRGLFANALLKLDILDADINGASEGYRASSDATSYGMRAEFGYRWVSGSFFLEPSASLEYQRTSLDDFTALGATIDFEDFDGLRGTAGFRLGGESAIGGGNSLTYYAGGSLVHEFEGGARVRFSSGTSSIDLVNDPIDTFGRFDLGLSILTPAGLQGFIEANGDVGEDYRSFGGRAGLRVPF